MNVVAAAVTLVHLLVGVLVLVPTLLYLRRAQNGWHWLVGLAIGATGVYLLLKAALGHSTASDHLTRNVHIIVGFLAAIWVVGKWLASHLRRRTPQTAALACMMIISVLGIAVAAGTLDYPADAYYRDLTATNAQQANNPLFPAGTRLAFGSNSDIVIQTAANWKQQTPEYCGRGGCHPAQYSEWLHSAHSSASSDPFYTAVETDFSKRKGETAAQYCAGCHAPIQTLAPQTTTTQSATNGVDCLSCHAAINSEKSGNGRLTFAVHETYPFAEATSGGRRWLHDFLLNVRPMPHQNALHHPELHSQPELCAGCHRQSFSVAQNHYQWVRTADTFGEWQNGAVSGRTARTAALSPQAAQTCQDCHFSRINGHTSHFSPGANTALAALNFDDEQQDRIEAFLKQERINLDIFSLRRAKKRSGQPQEWIAPLDKPLQLTQIASGESIILEVVVKNQSIGHKFPSGYDDLRDATLEITVWDRHNKVIARNADHRYCSVPLDKDGNALNHHELDKQVTLASKRSIPPGGSEVVRYAFALPKSEPESLRIQARLVYRHINPKFARWATGNTAELPSTVLATVWAHINLNSVTPATVPQGAERIATRSAFRRLWQRALLLPAERPDLSGAQRAFAVAQSLAPDRPEPYLGMGRVYLREPLVAQRPRPIRAGIEA